MIFSLLCLQRTSYIGYINVCNSEMRTWLCCAPGAQPYQPYHSMQLPCRASSHCVWVGSGWPGRVWESTSGSLCIIVNVQTRLIGCPFKEKADWCNQWLMQPFLAELGSSYKTVSQSSMFLVSGLKIKKTRSHKIFLTDTDHWRHLEVTNEEANSFPLVSKQHPFAQAAGKSMTC